MRLQAVSKLSVRDRIVLGLLRTPARADGLDVGGRAFEALMALVRDRGAIILFADNAYASRQELCLLSLLAIHQREQPVARFRIDARLRTLVLACSMHLKAHELILDHATAVRLVDTADDILVADVRAIAYRPTPAAMIRPCAMSLPARNSLQFKALEYIRAHIQVTAADLHGLGVSRQIASQMVKRGLIHRLRFGIYGIMPDAAHA